MAQTVHLKLQIDGTDIEGESTVLSLDREGTIECSSFNFGITTFRRVAKYEPLVIHKRVDKTTPLILQALNERNPVEAEFMFYRPSPGGSGAEEKFSTVQIRRAFIKSVRQVSEDAIRGGENAPPMMEEVAIVFKGITWTYEIGGAAYTDNRR